MSEKPPFFLRLFSQSATPKDDAPGGASPGGVGATFEQALLRHIASSLGISAEELTQDESNTGYSSARDAMSTGWSQRSRTPKYPDPCRGTSDD